MKSLLLKSVLAAASVALVTQPAMAAVFELITATDPVAQFTVADGVITSLESGGGGGEHGPHRRRLRWPGSRNYLLQHGYRPVRLVYLRGKRRDRASERGAFRPGAHNFHIDCVRSGRVDRSWAPPLSGVQVS